jgi:hypothetical protein
MSPLVRNNVQFITSLVVSNNQISLVGSSFSNKPPVSTAKCL